MLCQLNAKLCFIDFAHRAKHAVSQDTEVFQGESLGKTPDGWVVWSFDAFKISNLSISVSDWIYCTELNGILACSSSHGLTTYKELCSLASDLNQPDLVYKFMNLANHHAMWNSRKVPSKFHPSAFRTIRTAASPANSFARVLPTCREQLLGSTWLRPRPESSWHRSCPRSCPACTVTSLTPTSAFARPWPASGMPWWLTRPWYDLSPQHVGKLVYHLLKSQRVVLYGHIYYSCKKNGLPLSL